ncbi:RNA-binding domain-containing protein [Sphaerimonospora sp. CA-214678]|uniref:RNA-binding domain-containing protein n=1 Tax=Sphaerimonospora sp. CA-214678 TaxID=3240029 RepID=UPI003D8B8F41
MGSESATHDRLAELLASYPKAHTRLALRQVDDGWQLDHAYVTLNDPSRPTEPRRWRYAAHQFLDQPLSGRLLANLLGGEPQHIDGLLVTPSEAVANALFERRPSHRPWVPVTLPWPVTEWTISRAGNQIPSRTDLLIGAGPSFLNPDAAFAAFMYGAASQTISQSPLWRVHVIHPEAYLDRVTVRPDCLIVDVRGTEAAGTALQLSSPTTDTCRTVGRRRRIRFSLPNGIPDHSLLVLRRSDEQLDFRYLTYPGPGRVPDQSVVWEEPGIGLQLLINTGEGPQVEFKAQLPDGNSDNARRTMLKTVAAFASGAGGTILFGVSDDGMVTGLDPATLDRQRDRLVNMIRDLVTPDPPYSIRIEEIGGLPVLVLEVQPGRRGGYALFPDKPEFYVRRGATTFRARVEDIASAYGHF